ncbi:murein biosynthesis integral membrane protein MurJ [Demequina aestuarii]|uniref:murein biosynthesis integral membrane protein MurJ n=1 Tax=Demequina aestuarii TaxID=327095 RepID=UPI00078083FD|nr:lipid II flippase MurJ [Demequina aestuarii]
MTEPPENASAGSPEPRPRTSLRRSSAIMASGTATSRVLGLVRSMLLVAAIGLNADAANAYDAANRLPNAFFAILAAGVLNAALVPQIVKALHREGGERTVDRILTIGGVITLGATIAFTVTAQVWVAAYTDNWSPELLALATAFAYWCIPQLFFYGLYTLLGQVLNAKSQFGPFMWAPVLNNIVSIAGLLAFLAFFGPFDEANPLAPEEWTPGAIALIGGTATLGIMAQALILIIPLVRGGYRWHWRWRGPKGELTVIGRVAAWALAAVGVEQVGVLLVMQVASAAATAPGADAGGEIAGNAAYTQALSLYLVPHSVITLSLVTAMYTAMAGHAARGDMASLRGDLSRGLRTAGVLTVFTTAAMILFAPYVARVALPTATSEEVQSVAWVMSAMVIGLVPLGATVLFKRVYFVLEEARSIFFMHIPMTIAWVGVAWAFRLWTEPRWWTVGVGLGLAVSNLVGVVLRAGGLSRRLGGLDGRRILAVHSKAAIAAVGASAVVWVLLRYVPPATQFSGLDGVLTSLLVVLAGGVVMLALYAGGLWLLRVQEARDAARPLLRRLRRG